jgi:hypothetical protein
MKSQNESFKILKQEILNCFEGHVEDHVKCSSAILENKTQSVLHHSYNTRDKKLLKPIESKIKKSAAAYLLTIFPGTKKIHSGVKGNFVRQAKRHETGRIKGLAQKYSRKIDHNTSVVKKFINNPGLLKLTAGALAKKGKPGSKLFEIALNQAIPAIEKRLNNLGVK